jgi:AcrR family transcriptional regulator
MNVNVRQPGRTRQAILESAFWQFSGVGFRAARIDGVLADTGLTKGALYHHFPTKAALGLAVVDEIIWPMIEERWLAPVERADDPLEGLLGAVRARERDDPDAVLLGGCPLFTLLQDVAGDESPIRTRLEQALDTWRDRLARTLALGQAAGQVRAGLHPDTTAAFLIATYHGVAGTSKARQSPSAARRLLRSYALLIETLRPA